MSVRPADVSAVSATVHRIAIAGNPNSGKTSLFNQLTGLRYIVANYPGVTVEKREGRLLGSGIILVDLPGIYSLSARSPDEAISRDVLLGLLNGESRPDAVLVVIDASNLERNLYLATQLIEFGMRVVVACNLMDEVEARGERIDCELLSRELGVPVIPTVARSGRGLDELRRALMGGSIVPHSRHSLELPLEIDRCVEKIASDLTSSGATTCCVSRSAALLWMTDYLSGDATGRAASRRLVAQVPPALAEEMARTAEELNEAESDIAAAIIEARYRHVSQIVSRVRVQRSGGDALPRKASIRDRVDSVVTHRIYGFGVFVVVMGLLFLSIFSWAEPLMGMIESVQALCVSAVRVWVPDGLLQSLLADGIINGVGSVVVFFPQICILFLFLSILEDSGYMARAAFLMDRLMSRVGLHGRSFIPLLSSYACAIPGIMATRTIENRRDRLTTILIAPLMSCSARLPVYLILIAAVYGDRLWLKTGVMLGLYLLGTVTALLMAVVFKKTLLRGPRPTFIMELPPYRLPQARVIVRTMWDRSKQFLTGAGTTIVAACIVIWALGYFPRMDVADLSQEVVAQLAELDGAPLGVDERDHILAGAQLRQSWLGRLGHLIEPTIEPLGYDWRIGIGILSSFLAREVFVGTMGITFSIGATDDASDMLRDKLAAATRADGRPLFTPRVATGLMVFYVLACQCVSTLAVTRRETGSWKWPALMFGYMTVLAYSAALAINQLGAAVGWA
ncbi:MAG: ferrous iron transport protein B [Phycisphaerae bacterium]|nr:ferrous iron transport protein B [Phycisphaerae bacterium]